MTRKEALEVLGLQEGFTADELEARYRRLMRQYHGDTGGSDYLAKQVNVARDAFRATPRRPCAPKAQPEPAPSPPPSPPPASDEVFAEIIVACGTHKGRYTRMTVLIRDNKGYVQSSEDCSAEFSAGTLRM